MKKWLLVLGMITCIFGLTACGQTASKVENPMLPAESVEQFSQMMVETVSGYAKQGGVTGDAIMDSAIASWNAAAKDMGSYEGIISVDSDIKEKEGLVKVTIKGSIRNAVMEIVLDANSTTGITGISTNVEYSFAEKMEKAGLNTLLGMGTVFVVLILISLIISCFGVIPKIQESFAKKPDKKEIKETAVDNTIAQIIEKEELSDDLELVAVISAAIAASEGQASTDGFVVRSIRRAGNKWQRA